MIISDSFTLKASPQAVWDFLQDIPQVAACVPGVEGVEETGPDQYRGKLTVKVGPIRAAFAGRVTVLERVPGQRMAARVEGDDRASASVVSAGFSAALSPAEAGTRVEYRLDVALRGRLAQFGTAVMQATAKKITAEFAACVQARLVSGSGSATGSPAPESPG